MYRVAKLVGEGLDPFGAKGYKLLYPNGRTKTLPKNLVRMVVSMGKLTILNPNKDIQKAMEKCKFN